MSPTIHVLTVGNLPRRGPGVLQRFLIQIVAKVTVALLLGPGLIGTALAAEPPPAAAAQQRAWLVGHLVTDMQNVGSFNGNDVARMTSLVNSLADSQVGLLAQFYYLTREKAEQDVALYDLGQTESGGALAQAQAQVAGLLAQLQSQIQQTYAELAALNSGCQTLGQFTYASVPGWCANNQYAIPDAYYSGGCYVGPAYSAAYCGAYAAPVYKIFYNRGSRYNYWTSHGYIQHRVVRTGRLPVVTHAPVVVKHVAPPAIHHQVKARPVGHPQVHAVAHAHPRAAAHHVTHVKAHVAPRAHVQHVAHTAHAAHGSGGHGRRR